MVAAAWQTWGIGLITVTISAFAPPFAILAVPLLAKSIYERIMSTLVALGIGALSGSIMYIMVPQAMNATNDILFIKRSSLILGALYSFFLVDRLIQYLMEFRKLRQAPEIHRSTLEALSVLGFRSTNNHQDSVTVPKYPTIICQDADGHVIDNEIDAVNADMQLSEISNIISRHLSLRRSVPFIKTVRSRSLTAKSKDIRNDTLKTIITPAAVNSNNQLQVPQSDLGSEYDKVSVAVSVIDQISPPQEVQVASFAYMIIFGSSANNFVDGMSNGVAFSESLTQGLSVGIACITQQFPQELGMLAILARSGLGLKKAILLNMVPAMSSYLGFILGTLIQKSANGAAGYVYSVSSGMYLYILLGCLVPEMREAANELIKTNLRESFLTAALQFLGCAFGVLFMYAMARYGNGV